MLVTDVGAGRRLALADLSDLARAALSLRRLRPRALGLTRGPDRPVESADVAIIS